MKKPVIVYVSGAPGSGKTTLARILSEQLYIPHVSSDLIQGGVAFTEPSHDRKQTLLNVFVPTLVNMAQRGVSCIADHVLQQGLSETEIIDRLRPHASILYVHTKATDPIRRYIERIKTSEIPSIVARREHLLEIAALHEENLGRTSEPLKLGLPVIEVNTDNGYDPSIGEVMEFIKVQHSS